MKKFVALCVMGLLASACQFSTAADLKSGLQVDDSPPPFNVTDVTGPVAGTKLCYRCQYGSRPVVSIFVRKMDENTAKLVKQIDEIVGKQEEKKMAAFVTVLSDDPDAQESVLKKTADEQKIAHTPLTVFDNAALRAPDFALGSLCNLGLAAAAVRPAERSVHIAPGCYIGGQALGSRAPSPRPAWRSGSKSTAVPNCASPPSPPGAAPSGCMRPPWSPMPAPPAPGAAATMPPPTSIPRGSRPRRAKPGAAHPPEPCAAAQG